MIQLTVLKAISSICTDPMHWLMDQWDDVINCVRTLMYSQKPEFKEYFEAGRFGLSRAEKGYEVQSFFLKGSEQ